MYSGDFMKVITKEWKEYELLDAGGGEKLERWGNIILKRPDPQAIWEKDSKVNWDSFDANYIRSSEGGGKWKINKPIPKDWVISYKNLNFKISLTNFKHTGLFPEQAINWDFIIDKIRTSSKKVKVLNLFAYTGAATLAAAFAGAEEVVHVDASKGTIDWAKENVRLSNLENKKIKFIVDDCLKFVKREARRNNKYDVIIMDPPSFGRGPSGEVWKFEKNIKNLINDCLEILSDEPLLFLINSYTTGISPTTVGNILNKTILKKYPNGIIESGEIGIKAKSNIILPCGIYTKWESK